MAKNSSASTLFRIAGTPTTSEDGVTTLPAWPADFKPGRGFASEVARTLATLQPTTPDAVAKAMLADGSYVRVAPQAAALRPVRPAVGQLRIWLKAGLVVTVEPPATTPAETPAAPSADAPSDAAPETPTETPSPAPEAPAMSKSMLKKMAKAAAHAGK